MMSVLASPRSPTTIRTGSVRTSRARRSTFLRNVALNNKAVGGITELGYSGNTDFTLSVWSYVVGY